MKKKQKNIKDEADIAEDAVIAPEVEIMADEPIDTEPVVINFEDKWKRALADLDNMRKRSDREMEHLRKFASEILILDIMRSIEDMERAMNISKLKKQDGVQDAKEEHLDMIKGLEMILKDMNNTLAKNGVTAIETVGARFDPNVHEALMQACTDCLDDDNVVIEELQRGYMLHDKVIRYAKVKVAKYEEGGS